jgi:hypothetical protein
MENENLKGLMPIPMPSGGLVKTVLILLGLGGGVYFGAKEWKKYQERKAENTLDTPEGAIALALKNVFDSTIVSDAEFKQAYLPVNATNKDKVVSIYRALAGRNLSDDIAKHISAGALQLAHKKEVINNKKDGIIKISEADDITFLVSKGQKVVITDTTKETFFFASTNGFLWHLTATDVRKPISALEKIKASIVGRSITLTVDATKLLPYDGIKLTADWTKYIKPFTKTHKVFAVVRVWMTKPDGTKLYLWVDARELSKFTALKGLAGLTDVKHLAF